MRIKRFLILFSVLGLLAVLTITPTPAARSPRTAASPVVAGPAGLAKDPATAKATPFKGSWDSSETPTFVPAPPRRNHHVCGRRRIGQS